MTSDLFHQTEQTSVELYKSLRAEEASYLEKVPDLWLQKFNLLGALILFSLVRLRSATTVIVTAVPTALLIVLAGVVVGIVGGHRGLRPAIAGVAAAAYVMATVWFAHK